MTKPEIAHEDDGSFWADDDTTFVGEERDSTWVYHQEERTERFGEAVIDNEALLFAFSLGVVIRASSFLRPSSFGFRHLSSWPTPDLFKDLEEGEKMNKKLIVARVLGRSANPGFVI